MCLVACGMGSCVSGGCPGVGSDVPVVFHRVVIRVRTGLLILACMVSGWWVVRVVSGVENLAQQTDRGPGAYGCGRPDVVCPTQISLGAAGSRGPRGDEQGTPPSYFSEQVRFRFSDRVIRTELFVSCVQPKSKATVFIVKTA